MARSSRAYRYFYGKGKGMTTPEDLEAGRTPGQPAGKTLVAVATYNEMETLPALVAEVFRWLPQADMLVVDDNSPDGTGRWCDEQSARDQRLKCLHRPAKMGLGTATVAAMRYALEHGYAFVITMDADLSHPPRYLPDLLAGMEPAGRPPVDVMIGSRYVRGGRIEGWPWYRHLMSRAVNTYARWLLKLEPRDCSGAFRCYRVEALRRVDWGSVRSAGYSFQEEILWRLKRAGAVFGELPITFVDRKQGRSKVNLREALGALRTLFGLAWEKAPKGGH